MKRTKSLSSQCPQEEDKILALRKAILEGIRSGKAKDFDPKKHLSVLKTGKR